ncbi:hypothetical protein GGF42_003231 [Coemansia sp. RSA 2424]|nr:hypothetical protein GGF42_003231 [Coemansia sp. RSA 2424]
MLQSAQHESDKNAGAAAALSLDPSLAMPPPKAAPAQLGQSSSSTSSAAQTGRLLEPHFPLPLSHADQKLSQQPLLTPPLARKEMNQPSTSRSTSSTTTSTPPLASAALTSGAHHAIGTNVEAALKLAGNNTEPDLATPAADITSTPPRPESTVSTSPALSSTTKLPKAPSMPIKGGNSKDTKRKAGNTAFKRDAAVSSSVTAVGTTLITKRKPGQLASIKKSRTTPAQSVLHPPPQSLPLPLPIDTAPATPLASSITLPLSATLPPQAMANQLASKKLPRASSVTNIAASETLGSAPRLPSQAASRDQMSSAASDLPPVPLQTAQTLDPLPPVILSQKEVLGRGIEQLLKFHSVFAPADDAPDLDYWTMAISDNFCDIGNIRLELGTQSYDMPAAAASGFYHRLFSEGAAVSMHIALGRPNLYRLKQNSSIMSFHGVHMTTTYANGRRVLEAGDLRVIFGDDFRIRLWAFSSEDATVCLPRKRPNGTDEALTRTCEATIGRNLDWPNNPPVPKRRKSANGKQPPEECALPACALQHLEIANTMYYLQELIDLQLQNKSSPLSIMDLWMMAAKPEPLVTKQLTRMPGPERKPRTRKKSSATALPIPPQLLPPPAPMMARPDDAEPSAIDSKAKSSVFTVSPVVPPLASKLSRQQTKH